MAAAGIIDEKEDTNIIKCGCIAFLCKILHQFCKYKQMILVNQNVFYFSISFIKEQRIIK